MIKSYVLFTTPFCAVCPTVKSFLSTVSLPGQNLDATNEHDALRANSFNVRKVPTVVFLDESGNEVTRAHNVSEIRDILADC